MKQIILPLIFASLISFVSADVGDEYGCFSNVGGMMGGYYGAGGFWFGWLFMALIIVALVLLILWLIKQIQKK